MAGSTTGFNEAGADPPRKEEDMVLMLVVALIGFNEAGADPPRKVRDGGLRSLSVVLQ